MKRIYITILLLLTVIIAGSLQSCFLTCVQGSGNRVSENRKVDEFNKISISGNFKIVLKQDSSLSVKVTADDNLIKYIRTVSEGGQLRISTKRNACNSGEMVVNIGVRDLEELKTSGAIMVESDGKIKARNFRFKLSGYTKIEMNLDADNVRTSGSGASELHLHGQANSHDIDMSGSGKVYALDFVVGSCNIKTSGAGHNEVNVLHTLSIHSSGASYVKYRGNPSISNDKSGASTVEKAE
jgi:hypothetical protein